MKKVTQFLMIIITIGITSCSEPEITEKAQDYTTTYEAITLQYGKVDESTTRTDRDGVKFHSVDVLLKVPGYDELNVFNGFCFAQDNKTLGGVSNAWPAIWNPSTKEGKLFIVNKLDDNSYLYDGYIINFKDVGGNKLKIVEKKQVFSHKNWGTGTMFTNDGQYVYTFGYWGYYGFKINTETGQVTNQGHISPDIWFNDFRDGNRPTFVTKNLKSKISKNSHTPVVYKIIREDNIYHVTYLGGQEDQWNAPQGGVDSVRLTVKEKSRSSFSYWKNSELGNIEFAYTPDINGEGGQEALQSILGAKTE